MALDKVTFQLRNVMTRTRAVIRPARSLEIEWPSVACITHKAHVSGELT